MATSEDPWKQMEDNLRKYKESLVEILCVSDLIHSSTSFYHVIPTKDMEVIEALNSSNQLDKAARIFLDCFLSSEEVTKWSVLEEALRRLPGLNMVKKILLNEETPSLEVQQQDQRQVSLQRYHIAEHVSATALAEQLFQEEFLTEEQYQQVQAAIQSKGDIAANILQLELVSRRENFVPKLLEFLCRHQYVNLAKTIDPQLTKKICDSIGYEDQENESDVSYDDICPDDTRTKTIDYCSDPESVGQKAVPVEENSKPVADSSISWNNFDVQDEPVASRTRSKTKLLNDKTINVETVIGQESRNQPENIIPRSFHAHGEHMPARLGQRQDTYYPLDTYYHLDTTEQRSAGIPKEQPRLQGKFTLEMPIDCHGSNVFCIGPQVGDQPGNVHKLTLGHTDVIQIHKDESYEMDDDSFKDNFNARYTKINDVGCRERRHESKPTLLPTNCKPKENTAVKSKENIYCGSLAETRVNAKNNSHERLREKIPQLKTTVTKHKEYFNEDIKHVRPSKEMTESSPETSFVEGGPMYQLPKSRNPIEGCIRCDCCGTTWKSINALKNHQEDECVKYQKQNVKRSPLNSRSRLICDKVLTPHAQSHTKKVTQGLGFQNDESSQCISESANRQKQGQAKLLGQQGSTRSKQDTESISTEDSHPRRSIQTLIKPIEISGVRAKEQMSKQMTPPPQVSSGNAVHTSKDGKLIDGRGAERSCVDSRRQQIEDMRKSGSQQMPSRSQSLSYQSNGSAHGYQIVKSKPHENQVSNPQLLPNSNKLKRCLACGQTFQSQDFLDKHRKSSCLGNWNQPSVQHSKPESTESLTSQKMPARKPASDFKLTPSAGCSYSPKVSEHVSKKHTQNHITKLTPGFGFQSPQTVKYASEDLD